jgi:hypothetical protein
VLSYGPNFPELFRRAAEIVDKVLRGTKPADIPVEQPTRFELVVNSVTAKALGLTIPPGLLARAASGQPAITPPRNEMKSRRRGALMSTDVRYSCRLGAEQSRFMSTRPF